MTSQRFVMLLLSLNATLLWINASTASKHLLPSAHAYFSYSIYMKTTRKLSNEIYYSFRRNNLADIACFMNQIHSNLSTVRGARIRNPWISISTIQTILSENSIKPKLPRHLAYAGTQLL